MAKITCTPLSRKEVGMKSIRALKLFATTLLVTLHYPSLAQSTNPNQARADVDMNRQRSESLAVQRKNEQTEKEERAQFESRKKSYEKEDLRKEEQQKRDALTREKYLQKLEQNEKRSTGR
jgi:hypothetical protein